MRVHEVTRNREVDESKCDRVVVRILDDGVEMGYVRKGRTKVRLFITGQQYDNSWEWADFALVRKDIVFSSRRGAYIIRKMFNRRCLEQETMMLGNGSFPYTIKREYEARHSLRLFSGRQVGRVRKRHEPLARFMRYTFGLEFETSQGFVPEELCFRDGLIPLRDGSITGVEYSTVVLSGEDGLNMLRQQLLTLKRTTFFNKDCSLHVHMGGFPQDMAKIFRVNQLWCNIADDVMNYVPMLTFDSGSYKSNGKDYCRQLDSYDSPAHMYESIVGRRFFGSLEQPHPDDVCREHKWNVHSRYHCINFVNILCYQGAKTIEFRFLRPTWNYRKILLWLYIFNALLVIAEHDELPTSHYSSVGRLLDDVYPKDIVDELRVGLVRLNILKCNQEANGDRCGECVFYEDTLFDDKLRY